jgi:hypothetical protein
MRDSQGESRVTMTAATIVQVVVLLIVAAVVIRRKHQKRRAHDERLKRARFYKGDLT